MYLIAPLPSHSLRLHRRIDFKKKIAPLPTTGRIKVIASCFLVRQSFSLWDAPYHPLLLQYAQNLHSCCPSVAKADDVLISSFCRLVGQIFSSRRRCVGWLVLLGGYVVGSVEIGLYAGQCGQQDRCFQCVRHCKRRYLLPCFLALIF